MTRPASASSRPRLSVRVRSSRSSGAGLVDVPLRPSDHDGEALARGQRARRLQPRLAPVDAGREALLGAALVAGVGLGRDLAGRHPCRQAHHGAGAVDRQVPAVAGDVPVQLVVALEVAQLPVRAVADGVLLAAMLDEAIRAADVNTHAVRATLGVEGLRRAVARDLEHLESDPVAIAEPVTVVGREITVDAPPDEFAPRLPRRCARRRPPWHRP
jgi:hypothetical protein